MYPICPNPLQLLDTVEVARQPNCPTACPSLALPALNRIQLDEIRFGGVITLSLRTETKDLYTE